MLMCGPERRKQLTALHFPPIYSSLPAHGPTSERSTL
jgi:hypothetical protein